MNKQERKLEEDRLRKRVKKSPLSFIIKRWIGNDPSFDNFLAISDKNIVSKSIKKEEEVFVECL